MSQKWSTFYYGFEKYTAHEQILKMRHCRAEVQIRASAESPTEHTEWQRPFSGVHSIMMEKLAHDGEGGGCTPTPIFTISNTTFKVVVYAPAERAEPVFVNA